MHIAGVAALLRRIASGISVGVCGAVVATGASADSLLLQRATVVDVDEATASAAPMDILIEDGRIVAIEAAPISTDSVDHTVDATGLFVIPGLWDSHVHVARLADSGADRFLESGVTSVRDMGGPPALLQEILPRYAQRSVDGLAPTVYSSRTIIESGPWLRSAIEHFGNDIANPMLMDDLRSRIAVDDVASARRAVQRLSAEGADFIKIRNFADVESFQALCDEAERHGLRVAGHTPTGFSPAEAIASGLSSAEHGFLLLEFVDAERRTELESAIASALADSGAAVCPTIAAMEHLALDLDASLERLDAMFAGGVTASSLGLLDSIERLWRESIEANHTGGPPWPEIIPGLLRTTASFLADDRVALLAGTDVGAPLVQPGASLPHELRALHVQLEVSLPRVLRSATSNAADWLGVGHRTGRVRAGYDADLVLLGANPLETIDAYGQVRIVIKNGFIAMDAS